MSSTLTGNKVIDAVIIAAAVLTALGVIYRKAFRPAFRWVRRTAQQMLRAANLLEEILPVLPTLADIGRQFGPNGGASLRDSIDRIEEKQIEQGAKIDAAAGRAALLVEAAVRAGALIDTSAALVGTDASRAALLVKAADTAAARRAPATAATAEEAAAALLATAAKAAAALLATAAAAAHPDPTKGLTP